MDIRVDHSMQYQRVSISDIALIFVQKALYHTFSYQFVRGLENKVFGRAIL